jgi:hypothetical protein
MYAKKAEHGFLSSAKMVSIFGKSNPGLKRSSHS